MRNTTKLGLGLLLAGCAVLLVSTGGFESITAERGMELDTADDPDALLGITYPSGRPAELESDDADDGGGIGCYIPPCEYNDREIFVLEDNTSSGGLQLTDYDFDQGADDNLSIADGPNVDESGSGIATVTASFECDASGFILLDQHEGEGWVEIEATVSDGNVTIETTREVVVECVPDN